MFENVRGLLDQRFESFRRELKNELFKRGFELRWKLLQASDFRVPQLRPRVIGIALHPPLWAHFIWPEGTGGSRTVGEVLLPLMMARGWLGAVVWKDLANRIAPTLVGGSKKHGGPDLGPTRAKRQWLSLGVDALGLADQAPASDFVGFPRLTVEMAAVLQGFPQDWRFYGGKTAAYRQVGNAFPPPVAEAVGAEIKRVLEINDPFHQDTAKIRSSSTLVLPL